MDRKIDVERLHCAGGDDDDLGYYAKGHHSGADMRTAVVAQYGDEERRHSCAADPNACAFYQGWWRKVPRGRGGSYQFHAAKQGTPGAFAVTALLTEYAQI